MEKPINAHAFIIDVNPHLTHFGEAVCQLKACQNALRGAEGRLGRIWHPTLVTVSYSEPTKATLLIARNENVQIIKYDAESGKFMQRACIALEQNSNKKGITQEVLDI